MAILIVGILAASASLLLVEAMAHIRGNERFQGQVEFTTIAELYLGRRSHYILQIILYLALQSVNISSIIISCQVIKSPLDLPSQSVACCFSPLEHGYHTSSTVS